MVLLTILKKLKLKEKEMRILILYEISSLDLRLIFSLILGFKLLIVLTKGAGQRRQDDLRQEVQR